MGPIITGIVFCLAAVGAAFALRPGYAASLALPRATILWILAAPILFVSPSALLALVICAIAVVLLTPPGAEERAVFYLMALFAVPSALSAQIPFPGINYLTNLDFARAVCLALLVPVLIFEKPSPNFRYARAPGLFVLALTLLYSAQEFRSANLTSGIRNIVDDFLLYFIPFAALTRLLTKREHFDKAIGALGYVALIFFFAASISEAVNWNFYTYITERFGNAAFADFRDGVLRVSVTVNTILCGYVMALGLLAVEYFRANRKIGSLAAWFQRLAFVSGAYLTYSRGAWLSMAAAFSTYYFFTKAPRSIRMPAVILGLVILIPVGIYFAMHADFSSIDKFGTFEYRQQLLRTSIIQIKEHPLFGDPNFRQSANFANLVQGQGIVDIVNHYIQIALAHGLIALGIYVGAFAATAFGLFSLRKQIRQNDDRVLERQRAVFVAALAGYLLMIATTSAVSLT
ncbi:MAG TPA: O-antigen ligase family protein, partial [Parvularculaceae bacterium]|nr:O-antigen ligase family protein [Parvularculaceae bacterium]